MLVYGCGGVVAASALALDGVANAAVGPLALALVMSLFPAAEASRAIGLFLGLSALGIALGPLCAGVVIEALGWRAGFVAPALVAAIGGLGVWLCAPEVKGGERRKLDGIGALGVAVALLALVFGVVGASSAGWSHPRVLQSLAVGAGALVAFVWWERRVADPLLDMSLFRSRALNAALASPFVGSLVARRGPRPVILGGLGLIALGSFGLSFLQPTTPYPALLVALRSTTPPCRSAARSTRLEHGARILPEGLERQFEEAFRDAFTVGVARVFAVAAFVAVACLALAWFGIRPGKIGAHGDGR